MLQIKCAWCQGTMGYHHDGNDFKTVTHGICGKCEPVVLRECEKRLAEPIEENAREANV